MKPRVKILIFTISIVSCVLFWNIGLLWAEKPAAGKGISKPEEVVKSPPPESLKKGEKIVVKGVTIQGVFEVTAMGSRGVEEIKDLFRGVKDLGEDTESTVNIYTLGAPKYRVEVTSEDYKKAELALDHIVKQAEKDWSSHEGTIAFKRD